jgi:hypothetical protein
MKPRPHTHTRCGLQFPPQYHTSYKWGCSFNPITYRCLLRVLCPVRRPVTTLDCVLLKDSNRAFVAGLGPEINFRACVWILQWPRHIAKCWLSTQHLMLLLIFCLETPTDGSGLLMCTNNTDLQIMKVDFKKTLIQFWGDVPFFPNIEFCIYTQLSLCNNSKKTVISQ